MTTGLNAFVPEVVWAEAVKLITMRLEALNMGVGQFHFCHLSDAHATNDDFGTRPLLGCVEKGFARALLFMNNLTVQSEAEKWSTRTAEHKKSTCSWTGVDAGFDSLSAKRTLEEIDL
ncbi:hypothetical protein EVAR_84705_1 [Eumeta japonica]|uniref:Uncharacterized protein n=1 Tax=Eumeta variegata TaxID=151549 RepID=A0A4C1VSL9_EUMVA|nr:hypothetical protein EVAR_84705_1 [Eumeta japonica]